MLLPSSLPVQYGGLYTYLKNRYADMVVLTFGQIEDLLGFALPDPARVRKEWWTNADGEGDPTPQSRAWTEANRTAKPNLFARTVAFERVSA